MRTRSVAFTYIFIHSFPLSQLLPRKKLDLIYLDPKRNGPAIHHPCGIHQSQFQEREDPPHHRLQRNDHCDRQNWDLKIDNEIFGCLFAFEVLGNFL